jgi:hypothetical protein
MTREQLTAIESPCKLACETAQLKFGHFIPGGTLVLTVNSGYE